MTLRSCGFESHLRHGVSSIAVELGTGSTFVFIVMAASAEPPASPDPDVTAGRVPRLRPLPLSNRQIIALVFLIVGFRLLIDFGQRIVEGQQKVAQQRALEAEISALKEEQRALEAAKAYYSSPSYIEAWAHSEGKMVREGERLVIPLYDEPPPAGGPTAVDVQEAAPMPVWQVWWSLFFDTSPPFNQLPRS